MWEIARSLPSPISLKPSVNPRHLPLPPTHHQGATAGAAGGERSLHSRNHCLSKLCFLGQHMPRRGSASELFNTPALGFVQRPLAAVAAAGGRGFTLPGCFLLAPGSSDKKSASRVAEQDGRELTCVTDFSGPRVSLWLQYSGSHWTW